MYLTQSILRKTADEQKVHKLVQQYRKSNPGTQRMRDDRVQAYMENKQVLVKKQRQLAQLQRNPRLAQQNPQKYHELRNNLIAAIDANQKNIAGFEKERGLRREGDLTQESVEAQRGRMERMQNVYSAAMMQALPDEYKVEGAVIPPEVLEKAKAAGSAAAKATAKQEFGLFDADLARDMEAYSKYVTGGGRQTRIKLSDPKLNQAMNTVALNVGLDQKDPVTGKTRRADYTRAKGTDFDNAQSWLDRALTIPAFSGPVERAQHKSVADSQRKYQNRFGTAQAARNKMMLQGYADQTKNMKADYAKGRRDKVTGFLKENWLPIAGLGMGAMGLMAMWGNRNRRPMQQRQPVQQNVPLQQPGVDSWAQNRNFGFGATQTAGTQQDTLFNRRQNPKGMMAPFTSMFKKFMGGRNG